GDRGRSVCTEALGEAGIGEEGLDRSRESIEVAGLDDEAVLTVANDLRDTACPRRDHRRADRERLDDRMREVLPRRREERRVGGTEGPEHALRLQRPGEARVAEPLEGGAVRPITRDDERDARAARRLDAGVERLLRGQAAGECERRAVEPELGTQLL